MPSVVAFVTRLRFVGFGWLRLGDSFATRKWIDCLLKNILYRDLGIFMLTLMSIIDFDLYNFRYVSKC